MDPELGGTGPDIWIGHNFSIIIRALGPIHSLNASSATAFPEIKIAPSADAKPGDEGVKIVPSKVPDQYALTGVLESGALISGAWRTPGSAAPDSPTLIWLIDGTEGQIRIESTQSTGGFANFSPAERAWLNGELSDLTEENKATSATGLAWEAFANKKEGEYPTFEHAVVVHQHVEAMRVSAREGRKVVVAEIQ